MIHPTQSDASRPAGVTALAWFFIFGATMSLLAAITLAIPHSPLEFMWRINPQAREGFRTLGFIAVPLMLLVSAACAATAHGLWQLHAWGRYLAIVVLAINAIGDASNALIRHDWRTLIGIPIGGVLIWYLLSRRSVFAG
ncbi:MAG TPA: hypothetical protein VGP80_07925 [Gemmatimonadales bacterium]|nr:hypothetical protein [Gemmatimonadales bacterium]